MIDKIKWVLFGGIYSENYEEYADGGPTCFQEMTVEFRLAMTFLSIVIQGFIIYKLYPSILKSRELNLELVKNLQPSIVERAVGYCSIITLLIIGYYKANSGRFVFMLNPCHWVILMQSYLLTTKKTKFSAMVFISYVRWIFGPLCAMIFPDTVGFIQPYELEFFYVEHYLAAYIGPLVLILSGRYGFFKDRYSIILRQHFFGFAFHSLSQRLFSTPVSILTWANINFVLCHPLNDPWYPLVGKYYLYWVDHYLNLASILGVVVVVLVSQFASIFIIVPKKIILSLQQHSSEKSKNE